MRYGGTERIVANLANGLVGRGHSVTLFATGDSDTAAELVPGVDRAIWHDLDFVGEATWPVTRQLAQVFERQGDFDLIHSHADHAFFPLLYSLDVLAISTIHARLDLPVYRQMLAHYKFAPLISISDNQRLGVDDLGLNWLATVHHGLDPSHFVYSENPGQYLVFLGRLSPEKGPEAAIRVAREVGMPLRIAAKIPTQDHRYYEDVLVPLLKEPGVEFIGEVTEQQKAELLADACALLFPVDWPEPFGLALIESLAAGTPVVALRRGSVPEILTEGVTGYVCDSVGEMVTACGRLDELSRADCRQRFLEEFTIDSMVDRYEAVYQAAQANEPLPKVAAAATTAPSRSGAGG
jgi:glycosyltransferase involved in cell wall biosynthesis